MAGRLWTFSMKNLSKKLGIAFLLLVVFSSMVHSEVYGSDILTNEIVSSTDVTVCCEKTVSGLYCQDVVEDDCSPDAEFALPTSCESTAPCDPGYCYDSDEGTCLDNVPQMVCNDNGGTWASEKPTLCNLGCCILGDQAAFVTGVRCERLSAFYGLETNFNPDIQNEAQCILAAKSDEKGACVFEGDYGATTCRMVTRSECSSDRVLGTSSAPSDNTYDDTSDGGDTTDDGSGDTTGEDGDVQASPGGCEDVDGAVSFCPGMLCSAEELQNNCAPSEETTCVDGHEEVYFLDTCGNVANVYDASKINDDNYWKYIVDKSEACRFGDANIDSQTCGNCNYLLGSFCSEASSDTSSPTYGENICIDLNCEASDMTGGEERLHGESWCGFDKDMDFTFHATEENAVTRIFDEALRNVRAKAPISLNFRGAGTPVGSKYYRYICSHGEVIVEPCADFRQEECIENDVAGYTEAACVVNRWQDCTSVYTKLDCENTDRRDCIWMDGIEYVLIGGLSNGTTLDKSSLQAAQGELKKFKSGDRELGGCVPKVPPGLKFWGTEEGDNAEAASVCAQANAMCPVTYEKGLVGGDWECVENCECLEEATELARAQLCMSMGDCGPKVNYVGGIGRGAGYKVLEEDLESD
ncbi:MAG: hypothetical protein ABH864_04385 [archaeon]